MTINEYLNNIPDMKSNDGTTLKEAAADMMEIWTNNGCRGYCILAMKNAGFDREQIKTVLSELRWLFDEVPVNDAEKEYINF